VEEMFAYIKIFDSQNKVSQGYFNFSFVNSKLVITHIKGDQKPLYQIPTSEITDIFDGKYKGWNKMQFKCHQMTFIFVYSGYGGADYMKEHLVSLMDA
jgi:ABC-type phosphate transport system substrate-binding protein